MPQQAATIESLPMAFEFVKAMRADGLEWGEGYRELGRQAVAHIIEAQMTAMVDRYFDQLDTEETADRRNGHYRRHLLTTLGDIELCVPRTRRFSPTGVIRAYARREAEIDSIILAGFVLGLSTGRSARRFSPCSARRSAPRPSAESPGPSTRRSPPSTGGRSPTNTRR